MDVLGVLIEKYEDEHVAKLTERKHSRPHCPCCCGLGSTSYYSRVSTVDEIKKAAVALSVNEREELLSWLLDVDDDWDRQMAHDAAAGKLDFLIGEARTAVREETLRDWPKPKA